MYLLPELEEIFFSVVISTLRNILPYYIDQIIIVFGASCSTQINNYF